MQQQGSISQSDCGAQWQLVMTSSVAGPGRGSKALPKAKLAPQKGQGHCITTAFWILVKPLHLRSMLGKLMRCTKNWNACSWHWSTERAQLFSMIMPARSTTNASEVERTGLCSFASFAIFTWPLANWLPLLQASRQLFAGKTFPQPAGSRKCFPRVRQIRSTDFYATGINKLISHWQKCVDYNSSYFD